MPIDNPQATRFTQDFARSISRQMGLIKIALDDADQEWNTANIQSMFTGANLTENVQDHNGTTHPVTGQDVVNWALLVDAIRTVFNDPANSDKLDSLQRLMVGKILP